MQLPTVDPVKQFAADFKMQATSYAAHMMVKDFQTVREKQQQQQVGTVLVVHTKADAQHSKILLRSACAWLITHVAAVRV